VTDEKSEGRVRQQDHEPTEEQPEVALADATGDEADQEPQLALGRSLLWSALLVVVVLTLAVGAGIATWKNHREAQLRNRSKEASGAARTSVVKLLSYTPSNVLEDLGNESELLTGSFKDNYEQLVRTTIAPASAESQVTANATVVTSGVVKRGRDRVELLMFINVSSTSKQSATPNVTGSRVLVTVKRAGGAWRISAIKPI
jgi:Mce-associated membrane protein